MDSRRGIVALASFVAVSVALGGCASSDDAADPSSPDSESSTASPSSDSTVDATAPATTAGPAVATTIVTPADSDPASEPAGGASTDEVQAPLSAEELVTELASDALGGRDNQTPESLLAQDLLIGQLSQFAEPAIRDATGDDGFRQPFELGTNVVGVIPGGDLADEWIVIGAHYDHLGTNCPTSDPTDHICNGALDNATGVALVMETARALAAAGTPRRSVLVAFWDAEEDGLHGSGAYVNDPIVPLGSTVAYINYEQPGGTLFPDAPGVTWAVGAETGGPALVDAVQRAVQSSSHDTMLMSVEFGRGRSDYYNFVRADVPTVHFGDFTRGCYHTAQDEVGIVDFDKLDEQIADSSALLLDLASTDEAPELDRNAPPVAFGDVEHVASLLAVVADGLGPLPPGDRAAIDQIIAELRAITDAGAEAFDEAAADTVIGVAEQLAEATTSAECTADPS